MGNSVSTCGSVRKRARALFPSLSGRARLFADFEVASLLGFRQAAFKAILEGAMGPVQFPPFADGRFWFDKEYILMYWAWLCKEASEEDYKAIAEIIRRYDDFREFTHLYEDQPRDMIFQALFEWRGCVTYSRRLHMNLEPEAYSLPDTPIGQEKVQ